MATEIVNLTIDAAKCTACRACELACSFTKEGVFSPTLSRIRIMQVHACGLNVPVVCVNCADAPCIPACPTGAVYRDRAVPVVRINEEECTGCGECVDACPFGAVDRPAEKDVAIVCDLCDGAPACVTSCIYGALSFEPQRAAAETAQTTRTSETGETSEVKRWATARAAAERIRGRQEVRV